MTSKNRPIAWALYDFANTIYSMNVVSLYFPLWITIDKGLPEIAYSAVYSVAVILAALLSPLVGVLSDLWRSRQKPLIVFTLICIFFTCLLGAVTSAWSALCFFLLAHMAYLLSFVFYNAMLPEVAGKWGIGKVSGFGVGVGYMGTIVGLLVASQFHSGSWGRQGVFLPTGFLFLLFALPLFFLKFKKEEMASKEPREKKKLSQCFAFFKWTEHSPKVKWFLGANFLCADAAHTLILFMGIYSKKVFGLTDDQITLFFILSTVTAILASFAWGEMLARFGALKSFKSVLAMWLVTFLIGAIARHASLYWVVGSLAGISLAGTWTVARAFLIELVPKERVGEYFGLYNFTGKSAAVVGPLFWSTLLLIFTPLGITKYRIALFAMTFFILGSFYCVRKIVPKEA